MTDLSPTAKDALAALRLRDALDPAAKDRLRARIEASIATGEVGPADAREHDARGALDARGIAIRVALPVAIAAAVLLSLWAIAPDDARRDPSADRGEAAYGVERAADTTSSSAVPREAARAPAPGEVSPPAPSPTAAPLDPEPPNAHAEGEPATAPVSRHRQARHPVGPAVGPAAPSGGSSDTTLAEEMRLLKRARAAMRDGDPEGALAALAAHAEAFARGQMVEDRHALKVEALCAAGRREDARAAASAFARAWPRSPHVARVQTICAGE